ncbi:hypothetical protein VOLCADRAFT_64922, partial [Volvox carteri f. nagariensis]
VNKYAVQVLPLPVTILLIQTLTTAVLLQAMAAMQMIRVPSIRAIRVQQLAPLSICYSVHAVLVLYSLAFLSIPMYNTLKRLTPVMVLATKAVMDKRWPDAQTTSSVLLIVSGCMVAGAGDLSFDGQGYSLALLCAFMQATYILLAEKASGSVHAACPSEDGVAPLSATELLYSICVISVPALVAVCVISGEGARAPRHIKQLQSSMGHTTFYAWLGITAVTEGLLTGSVILCTQMNSALTTSIVGVLKGAVSSVLGFFLLGGVKFHIVNVAGITMNMVGGIWYSAVQYMRRKTAA